MSGPSWTFRHEVTPSPWPALFWRQGPETNRDGSDNLGACYVFRHGRVRASLVCGSSQA